MAPLVRLPHPSGGGAAERRLRSAVPRIATVACPCPRPPTHLPCSPHGQSSPTSPGERRPCREEVVAAARPGQCRALREQDRGHHSGNRRHSWVTAPSEIRWPLPPVQVHLVLRSTRARNEVHAQPDLRPQRRARGRTQPQHSQLILKANKPLPPEPTRRPLWQ